MFSNQNSTFTQSNSVSTVLEIVKFCFPFFFLRKKVIFNENDVSFIDYASGFGFGIAPNQP